MKRILIPIALIAFILFPILTNAQLTVSDSIDVFIKNIMQKPIASINREFSAPIKLKADLTLDDQLFLMGNDRDSFNRFEAGQVVGTKIVLDLVADLKNGIKPQLNPKYIELKEQFNALIRQD